MFWRRLFGDVDDDGQTTVRDALSLLRVSVGLDPATPRKRVREDIDGRPGIGIGDVVLVLRGSVGLTRL
ncbi:MAG: hypothetical protein ACUVRO_02325 [Armatimonadota bacterium]